MVEAAQGDLLTQEISQTETTWFGEENKELVAQRGWKSGDDAISSYRELEKSYSGRVKMPSPESSAEEIRAFYQKTGCPENPEGYEVTGLPEDMPDFIRNEETEKALKQIAYDTGVSKQAFEAIVKGFYEKADADIRANRLQGEKDLREEHGDKYEEVVNIAGRFFDTCSPEFCELVKATGLANHPVFINEFNNKGKQTMADVLVKGTGGEPAKDAYVPEYKDSPEMYKSGEDEDSVKSRAYFEARGHKY